MKKISKIKLNVKYKSIKKPFNLKLGDLTVITGVNNSGKTNFIEAVNEGKKYFNFEDSAGNDITDSVETTYIPAEIVVADDKFKIGKTSDLIKELKKHIAGNPIFKLQVNDNDNKQGIDDLFDLVNKKLNNLLKDESPTSNIVQIQINESLSLKDVLEQAFSIEPTDSESGTSHKNFTDLGQGWQRLIIVSFILASSEKSVLGDKLKLILIEEPEIYLHPRLKKALNIMLKSISKKSDYQVIITTHDPYFAMSNSDEDNSTYSFSIGEGGFTVPGEEGIISGIEDELLHIFLFNKVLVRASEAGKDTTTMKGGGELDEYIKSFDSSTKDYLWDTTPVGGNPLELSLPISIRHMIHHPDNIHTREGRNQYDGEELQQSIKILNKILGT